MEFKLPTFSVLENIINLIENEYLAEKNIGQGENPERTVVFQLYRITLQKTRHYKNKKQVRQILFGILVYALEMIKEVEHKGFSPRQKTSFFAKMTGGGSSLYTKIIKHLSITESKHVSKYLRLVCLFQFFQFAKANLKYKPELIASIDSRLFALVENLKNCTKEIVEDYSFLEILQKNIKALGKTYHASCLSSEKNPKREAAVTFVNYIQTSCVEEYALDEKSTKKNFNYIQSCNTQVGAVIFIMLLIKDEYKNWPWLSEKKRLYKACLDILHIKDLKEIDSDEIIACLRALSEHCKIIDCECIFKLIGFEDFPGKLKQFISEEEIKKNEPGYAESFVNYIVRYGVSLACTQYSAGLVLPATGALATTLGGPVGLAIYLGGGTLIFSQLGRLVSDGYVSRGASYLYAWTLDKIGTRISKGTIEAFKAGQDGFQELRSHKALTPDDQELIDDLIATWLQLPDHMVSEKEKNEIRQLIPSERKEEALLVSSFVLC